MRKTPRNTDESTLVWKMLKNHTIKAKLRFFVLFRICNLSNLQGSSFTWALTKPRLKWCCFFLQKSYDNFGSMAFHFQRFSSPLSTTIELYLNSKSPSKNHLNIPFNYRSAFRFILREAFNERCMPSFYAFQRKASFWQLYHLCRPNVESCLFSP